MVNLTDFLIAIYDENTVTRDHLLGSREPQLLKLVVNNLVVGDVELIVG